MRRRKQNGHHSQRTEAAEKVPFCAVCLIVIIHRGLMVLDWGKEGRGQPNWSHARPRGRAARATTRSAPTPLHAYAL